MITESEKSHTLPPASWRRPRKAENPGSQWCKFQSKSEDLRTRSANAMYGSGEVASQLKQSNVSLSPLFCSFQALNGAVIPPELVRWGSLLSPYISSRTSSRISQRHTPKCLPAIWASLSLVKLTPKVIESWEKKGIVINGMSALTKVTPGLYDILLLSWEDTARRQQDGSQ